MTDTPQPLSTVTIDGEEVHPSVARQRLDFEEHLSNGVRNLLRLLGAHRRDVAHRIVDVVADQVQVEADANARAAASAEAPTA
jgi:hypothetical protein